MAPTTQIARGAKTPSTRSLLAGLTKARIADIARERGVTLVPAATKEAQIDALFATNPPRFRDLVELLGRDELRAACRAHDLDDSGRSRPALAARLLQAHGAQDSVPPQPLFASRPDDRLVPRVGDIVGVRHRQWLVESTAESGPPPDALYAGIPLHTLVSLVCLDDDNQGDRLDVLWELELGARILRPETHLLADVSRLDPPRHFGAYLHALKWNAVTATDARLFQAPFRAGIKLMRHQLTPLKKALELPRANLFIADDVGLGKTIEAGLILQELILRQRIDFVLIVCPASVALQWKAEMAQRFGLHFEIYSRQFMARRRTERGFQVNPWNTHNRFIISYQTLRRPEYRDPLLARLGDRARKSLLILDEAHTAAPASPGRYAIDSRITHVIRDVAPRFENRLFLSATPHNGHSNSFSALLEILDPQRFTRAIEVSPAARDTVMVRRLKADLLTLNEGDYPVRRVIRVDLPGDHPELQLSRLLAEYTELMMPKRGKRGALAFINLQKRLLSSVDAFHRTLELHAKSVLAGTASTALSLASDETDDDEYGADDDTLEAQLDHDTTAASSHVATPEGRARQLLDEMTSLAARLRAQPDAKAAKLIEWLEKHPKQRVIVFTEYGDTKKWLRRILTTALDVESDDETILDFHGGMSDEQREHVQRSFNSPLADHPVRVLLATDAAREGVNLQGCCADLFHFDIPWNPARMEQRNGRIDRTLQPQKEVRCHYFHYPERREDAVLEKLVAKVEVIQRELGSLGSVIMQRMEDALARGIDARTASALDEAEDLGGRRDVVTTELESQRADLKKLRADIDDAATILNDSARVTSFREELLKDAVEVGLELAGARSIDTLPRSWDQTVDYLRPPRDRDEPFWDWRKRPPRPVVYKALDTMDDAKVHLHLSHPFVQRILSRFRAQGFSAHDLARVTVVKHGHDAKTRVIAFGRLSLFGPGATRLHDELISVAAEWKEGATTLKPFAEAADRRALERLEDLLAASPALEITDRVQKTLRAAAPTDFATLWKHIETEADAKAHDATRRLTQRARDESASLRAILESQRDAIRKKLAGTQIDLPFDNADEVTREQWRAERRHLEHRLASIDAEIATEAPQIESLYQVMLRRLEPVGLVYLWPETRS